MDTFTHGITGALIGKSLPSKYQQHGAVLAVTIGSIFPDTDFIGGLFADTSLARLEIHRGITHSLVALPVFALLFGVLTCLLRRENRWLFFSSLYAVGIASHILLDVITSYGTMIWAPLNRTRAAWDLTFIIDFTLTSIVLLPQLIAWVYSGKDLVFRRALTAWSLMALAAALVHRITASLRLPLSWPMVAAYLAVVALLFWLPSWNGRGFLWQRAWYCRIGVGALAVYLSACALAHQAALARVAAFAAAKGATVERLAALPSPPSLRWWAGLVQTPEGVYRVAIHLGGRDAPASRFFPNAEKNPYVREAESLPDVKIYLWFARFPWVTYREENGFHIIEYRDIQFFFPPSRSNPPFTLRVSFDHQGRVVSSALLEP